MFDDTNSKAMYDRACTSLAMGVATGFRRAVTPVPLYYERADGPYYYDVDGHELLDYTLAWGPLILGSNHPALNRAVTEQVARSYTLGAQHAGEFELAELMVEVLPGVDQVILSNTGSEAVQAALRIARAFTGRNRFVKFEGHYHGWFNNVLVSCHPDENEMGRPAASCGGQPGHEFEDTLVVPWNDLPALEKAFADHPDRIACVLAEPILANCGSCMPVDGFLEGIIELCQEHGALSIFDEVITGFRLALGGAREYFGLTPDLSTYAKALAGGFSMSAVGGRRELFDVLRDGRTIHAGTYNGNSIGVAAATATISTLREPGLYDRMHRHGHTIRETIEKAATDRGHRIVTSGAGTVFSVHWGVDAAPSNYAETLRADHETYRKFRAAMLERGIQLLPDARWYVGAVHGDAELEKTVAAVQESMKEI
ncbi:MAG: aspartate aminotransferase family protein [Phycisphaeraceae bacterium]|nr:aspartate aminotransferase family protein [Phycisphaeraceae bacterium]